jgi:hypothetical protein
MSRIALNGLMHKKIINTKKAARRQPLLTKIKLKIFGLVRESWPAILTRIYAQECSNQKIEIIYTYANNGVNDTPR